MKYQDAYARMLEADEQNDLLGVLEAQKTMLIHKLSDDQDENFEANMNNLSRITGQIIKLKGLRMAVSDDDLTEMSDEEAIRRVVGIGGLGGVA
jgi:hypothetical protein